MFELLEPFGIRFFHFRRQPISLNQVERNNPQQHDHQQHFPQPLKVADQSHHRAAEEIARAREYENPQKTTPERKHEKPQIRHVPDAVEHARSPPQSVNVFGKEDRERPELVRQSLQPRLRRPVKTKPADAFTKTTPGKIRDVVAQTSTNSSPHPKLHKAVRA